jgi:DNA-binding GntR family transcriptional regulator
MTSQALRFKRVQVVRAYKAIYEMIEKHIVNGELKPGTLMPTELKIAAQFGNWSKKAQSIEETPSGSQ